MCKLCESRRKLENIEAMIEERENDLVLLDLMRDNAELEIKVIELEMALAERK